MIVAILAALSAATTPPPNSTAAAPVDAAAIKSQLDEAQRAAEAGRLEQARLMISKAIAAGASQSDAGRAVADLAFESAKYPEALALYKQLLVATPMDPLFLERAGISAFQTGDMKLAASLIGRATALSGASWRAWNARGAIADMDRDWAAADAAYEKAGQIAPDRAEIVNNRGWSRLLRGDWTRARDDFERAAQLDPKSTRIANNLELARDALAVDLPRRLAGEPDHEWAARLNDAGVAAQLLGDQKRAIAAFTQALESSGSWYQRAANNLEAARGR